MKKLSIILSILTPLSSHCMELPPKVMQLTVEYAGATWQNQKYRDYQEDKIFVSDDNFFGVYDGHGSNRSNDNVSSFLQNNLYQFFKTSEKETVKEKLEDAFARAEEEALTSHLGGSTAVVSYIDAKQVLHLAWAGDSRAVVEKKGMFLYATKDHDVHNMTEMERIIEKGLLIEKPYIANESNYIRLAVSRSIGDADCKEVTPEMPAGKGGIIALPEYHAIQLTPAHNFIIMATDGLFLDVPSAQAVELVTTTLQLPLFGAFSQHALEPEISLQSDGCDDSVMLAIYKLALKALARESEDNIAILILQLKWKEKQKEI